MGRPVSRNCARCGIKKTEATASPLKARAQDGSLRFNSWCRKCAASSKTEARRRRGVQAFTVKVTCTNGHERATHRRAGRYDCAICHRERAAASLRQKGVPERVRRVTHCKEGHALVAGNLRRGIHAGECLLCHRLRETGKYDEEARKYAAILIHDPCSYCGREGGTIDHIVARADGGTNDWWNLTAACHSCNARKRAAPLVAFLLQHPVGPQTAKAAA